VRVVQVGKYYFPDVGGIESHLLTLSNELKREVDLDVVVSNTRPYTVRDVIQGVSVTRCASAGAVAAASITPTMALELSQRNYDLIHIHVPHPVAIASYLASRKPKRHRLVVGYHSDVVRQRRLAALYEPLLDQLLRRADAVIATSPNYIESSGSLARHRSKCVAIPLGIDLAAFEPNPEVAETARKLRERRGSRHLLLGVGRLVYYKGFEHAIRALPLIPDAELAIVGEGPLRRDLESLARDLGVADRLHLPGRLSDPELLAYYHASDAYLLPSVARSEAFAIVQIEAMACGLPVVNTQLDSGVPFVSPHGESGLTVPPGDHLALADAVRALLASPETRRRYGEAGRRRALAEFSKEKLAERTLRLYRELCA
jgi:rhamnosyl/mannosyltransferase